MKKHPLAIVSEEIEANHAAATKTLESVRESDRLRALARARVADVIEQVSTEADVSPPDPAAAESVADVDAPAESDGEPPAGPDS